MKMIEVSEDALESIKRMAEQDAKDAARWRWARDRLSWEDIHQMERDFRNMPVDPEESALTNSAIDAAMQAKP